MTANHEKSGRFVRPESRSSLDAPSVLVAEANPDLQWRLARTLTVEGYRVIGTSSAAGALALLEHWSVDAAIISEHIWNEQGSEFLVGRLRRLHSNLPIILIASAKRQTGRAAIGPATRLDAASPIILRPPIQPENVRTALERALPGGGPGSGLLTAAPTG